MIEKLAVVDAAVLAGEPRPDDERQREAQDPWRSVRSSRDVGEAIALWSTVIVTGAVERRPGAAQLEETAAASAAADEHEGREHERAARVLTACRARKPARMRAAATWSTSSRRRRRAHVGLEQDALGRDRGEPLVPELEWQAEMRGDLVGEGADPRCLGPLGPVHVERQSDHDPLGGVRGEHLREGLQVALPADALDDADPLRRDAELVADRDPDARVAHVEGCDAHGDGH